MSITRRTMLTAAPAITLGGPALAQTQPPAQTSPAVGHQAPGYYRYKVGDIEVTAIHDGFARRPLEGLVRNADLNDIQKAMADAFLPTDALPITFTTLTLRTGGRFHPDHINGLRLKDGTAVFPNAEVMTPAPEWAFWMDDGRMAQAPEALKGNFQNVRRVFGPIAKDVKPYEAGRELAPGLTAVAAPGHMPGHTAYAVSSGSGKLLVVSDITNHPALFARHPDWQAVFDMDGNQARDTRRRMLDMAAAERTQVSFYHAPFPATGHIAKAGTGYEFVPVQWTPAL
jgi:hypothetical protein